MRNLQYGIPMAMAANVVAALKKRGEMVIFSESCTAGAVSAAVGGVAGASEVLCGSFVTYRPSVKMKVLGVTEESILKHTTESREIALHMAMGALNVCDEAKWSVSIVGHFGPNAPDNKDGMIYFCIVKRGDKEFPPMVEKLETYRLSTPTRVERQYEATEVLLTFFGRCLIN